MTKNMFGRGNSKLVDMGKRLNEKVITFDMLAGHTCPMAKDCLARVMVRNGKKHLQKLGKFTCYAVKAELIYPAVYNLHKANYARTKRATFVSRAIREIQKSGATIVRIHSAGDFYDYTYFQKWVEIAKALPHIKFFGYTKQATFVNWLVNNPIENMKIVYSHGGILDAYAASKNLPTCYVELYDGQYDVPLACDTVKSDDYEYIMRQESFKIEFH